MFAVIVVVVVLVIVVIVFLTKGFFIVQIIHENPLISLSLSILTLALCHSLHPAFTRQAALRPRSESCPRGL